MLSGMLEKDFPQKRPVAQTPTAGYRVPLQPEDVRLPVDKDDEDAAKDMEGVEGLNAADSQSRAGTQATAVASGFNSQASSVADLPSFMPGGAEKRHNAEMAAVSEELVSQMEQQMSELAETAAPGLDIAQLVRKSFEAVEAKRRKVENGVQTPRL